VRTHSGECDWDMRDVLAQLTRQQQSRAYSLNFVKDAISVGIVPFNLFNSSPNVSVELFLEQPKRMRLVMEWNSIAHFDGRAGYIEHSNCSLKVKLTK
jgi:hypothetical protein